MQNFQLCNNRRQRQTANSIINKLLPLNILLANSLSKYYSRFASGFFQPNISVSDPTDTEGESNPQLYLMKLSLNPLNHCGPIIEKTLANYYKLN